MVEVRDTDYPAIHRAMVERLQAATIPAQRLLPVQARLVLWLTLDAILLVWIALHAETAIAPRLARPAYVVELSCFLAAAILFAASGLRSVIPGRARSRLMIEVALGLTIVALIAITVSQPVASLLTLDRFAQTGVNCAIGTTIWALIPWIVLWWMCRRAAPLEGAKSGILIGAGAVCFSAAAMRIACPLDEPAHLLVWHIFPGVLLAVIAMLAGTRWLHLRKNRTRFPEA